MLDRGTHVGHGANAPSTYPYTLPTASWPRLCVGAIADERPYAAVLQRLCGHNLGSKPLRCCKCCAASPLDSAFRRARTRASYPAASSYASSGVVWLSRLGSHLPLCAQCTAVVAWAISSNTAAFFMGPMLLDAARLAEMLNGAPEHVLPSRSRSVPIAQFRDQPQHSMHAGTCLAPATPDAAHPPALGTASTPAIAGKSSTADRRRTFLSYATEPSTEAQPSDAFRARAFCLGDTEEEAKGVESPYIPLAMSRNGKRWCESQQVHAATARTEQTATAPTSSSDQSGTVAYSFSPKASLRYARHAGTFASSC